MCVCCVYARMSVRTKASMCVYITLRSLSVLGLVPGLAPSPKEKPTRKYRWGMTKPPERRGCLQCTRPLSGDDMGYASRCVNGSDYLASGLGGTSRVDGVWKPARQAARGLAASGDGRQARLTDGLKPTDVRSRLEAAAKEGSPGLTNYFRSATWVTTKTRQARSGCLTRSLTGQSQPRVTIFFLPRRTQQKALQGRPALAGRFEDVRCAVRIIVHGARPHSPRHCIIQALSNSGNWPIHK